MGIDNVDALKPPAYISDMENYIKSRQRKGKTTSDVINDLMSEGYDFHAARAFIWRHWEWPQ